MSETVQYIIVALIILVSLYYVWTRVLFKKKSKCSGCDKCES